jgi:RimJ/RimL family protein N-acetyltransferase
MMREAVPADAAAIDAFLAGHAESSMYLRGNLARHGVGFGADDHSTRFFLLEDAGITGVFGVTKNGYLMAQVPDMTTAQALEFLRAIAGQPLLGMTGVTSQVETVLSAAGLQASDYQLRHDEPLCRMDLADLPDQKEPCRPATEADLEQIIPMFAGYLVDTAQADAASARTMAPDRARADLAGGQLRLLIESGRVVAMANLNAVVAEHVQVGGVYVPAEARGRGYGARITIGLLQHAREQGARTAVLFANNETAARVYENIGFRQIGWYGIALLAGPEVPQL